MKPYNNHKQESRIMAGDRYHYIVMERGFIDPEWVRFHMEVVADSDVFTAPPEYKYLQFYNELQQVIKRMIHREAKAKIRGLKRELELLPQTASDLTSYLRKKQLAFIEILSSHPKNDVFVEETTKFYTMGFMNHAVLDDLWKSPSWSAWTRQKLTNKKYWIPNYIPEEVRPHLTLMFDDIAMEYMSQQISDEDYFKFWKRAHELMPVYLTLYVYYTVIRWIRRQIWILDDNGLIKSKSIRKVANITQARLALYYLYLHITESVPDFESHKEGKTQAYKEAVAPYGYSWEAFRNKYNQFLSSATGRKAASNATNIRIVMEMLKDYPRAFERAQDEYTIATSQRG